jgi:uncharacterized iron-regulated membrane protein
MSTRRLFRINLWLHRWSSLIATPFFLILCVTGTVLIFHHEIDEALGYVPTAGVHAGSPLPLSASIAAAQAANPDQRVLLVGQDEEEHPGLIAVYMAPKVDTGFERAKPVFVEAATAKILDGADPNKTPTGIFLELHAQWFLGPLGELVGALIALLVLISIVSGVVIYAPYVRNIAFGVIRRGRGKRLVQLDLHNLFGAVVLGWLVVVTVTGFLLGFGTLAQAVWQNTELKALKAQLETSEQVDHENPPISFDQAFSAVAKAQTGWRPTTAVYPGTDLSTAQHYTILMFGEKGVRERMFRIALVNARTGTVDDIRDLPAYLQAIQVSQPLHFGDYGGLALKILWVACSWLALFITGNGAWLWWNRRRQATVERRAVPEPVT